MQLKPFSEILKMSKDQINEEMTPVLARKAKIQAELKIAELDEKIVSKEQEIMSICTKKELNFDALVSAQDALALLERKKRQLLEIVEQLFPAAPKAAPAQF